MVLLYMNIYEFQIKLCCVPKKRKRKRKVKRKLRLEINRNSLKQLKDFHIATIYNYEIATITRWNKMFHTFISFKPWEALLEVVMVVFQ